MRTHRDFTTALLAVGLVVSLLTACGGGGAARSMRTAPDDLTITARVKTALLNDPEITAPRIDVETQNAVVTLSGEVASKQEEQKAIQIARSVKDVKDVKSTLQIKQE